MGSTKTHTPPATQPVPSIRGGVGGSLRRMPAVRAVVRSWRELSATGATRRTVVACSGGADSGALALALATASDDLLIAHIVHDMRPEAEALADRDATRGLADSLGLPFVEASVRCAERANAEASARAARYLALAEIARSSGAPFIATAHHADDQLESMVMGMLRGAGPAGLAGVAPSRPLSEGVAVIRPMLGVDREQAEAICREAGFGWVVDQTNIEGARGALRHGAIAEIRSLRPGASLRASRAADHLRDAATLLDERVEAVFGDRRSWSREALRRETALVVGAGLRRAALELSGGEGADRLTSRVVDPVVRAVRDESTEPRDFTWKLRAGAAVVTVGARSVEVGPR